MKIQIALLIALSALALTARADNCPPNDNRCFGSGPSYGRPPQQPPQPGQWQPQPSQPQPFSQQGGPGYGNNNGPGYGGPSGSGYGGPGYGNDNGPGHGGPHGPPPYQPAPQQPPGQWQPPQPPYQGGYNPQPPPDDDQQVPYGSYRYSCRRIEMNNYYLSAICRSPRGRVIYSTLDLRQCQGSDIQNLNGFLACAPRYGDSRD